MEKEFKSEILISIFTLDSQLIEAMKLRLREFVTLIGEQIEINVTDPSESGTCSLLVCFLAKETRFPQVKALYRELTTEFPTAVIQGNYSTKCCPGISLGTICQHEQRRIMAKIGYEQAMQTPTHREDNAVRITT